MKDKDLYAKILGIESPWTVSDVKLDLANGMVEVFIERSEGGRAPCPECGKPCPGYDTKERRWRHLDTCQFQTILVAQVPRVKCDEHGVHQIKVPWAEPGSSFTALFEALAIDWLQAASITAVAKHLRITWDEVDGIMDRAVNRGLLRDRHKLPARLGVDEKCVGRGHDYLTIVSDLDTPRVVFVEEGRKRETIDKFYDGYTKAALAKITDVAMDMWGPFIESTRAHLLDADKKISFDKFHVAKHLGDAVDKVRRQESKELAKTDDNPLRKTKYLWLRNPQNMSPEQSKQLQHLKTTTLRTARAWAIKEYAMMLWSYVYRGAARAAWTRWLAWASRCRLEPMVKAAATVRNHLDGIVNAAVSGVTNAAAEGLNSKIQWIKYMARGFRSRPRFVRAIYFHLGGLQLYPEGIGR
jgi:transposase